MADLQELMDLIVAKIKNGNLNPISNSKDKLIINNKLWIKIEEYDDMRESWTTCTLYRGDEILGSVTGWRDFIKKCMSGDFNRQSLINKAYEELNSEARER